MALGRVGQERSKLRRDILSGEAFLKKLGNDAPPGDQVGHGDRQVAGGIGHLRKLVRVANQPLGQSERER